MADLGKLQYLKQVSRIKHRILKDYLEPWAAILGSAHSRLGYMDCFAGRGAFVDEQDRLLPGSPLVALQVANEYVAKHPGHSLVLGFSEKDHSAADQLRAVLASEVNIPSSVSYRVEEENAQDFVQKLVSTITQPGSTKRIIPTFFFVDPYGHPITIPVMQKLLSLGQTEILVNLMWFRINMHLSNPAMQGAIDQLFGHSRWRTERFTAFRGWRKEQAFVDYFVQEVGAKYHQLFLVPYSPEDRMKGKEKRRKYYLIHFSNHPRAALLMKSVMWKAMDDVHELQLSREDGAKQLRLLGSELDTHQLSQDLLRHFAGKKLSFEEIQVQTLHWNAVAKHHRAAIKQLEKGGKISVFRVESKKTGLGDRDLVAFP